MTWRWIGLEDDEHGGIHRAIITEAGELTVRLLSGSVMTGPVAETVFGGDPGSVMEPETDELITGCTPEVAGLYMIEIIAWFADGTPDVADIFNMCFKLGDTVLTRVAVMSAINIPATSRFYVNGTPGVSFGVHSVGAGTSEVVYSALLTATRLV